MHTLYIYIESNATSISFALQYKSEEKRNRNRKTVAPTDRQEQITI